MSLPSFPLGRSGLSTPRLVLGGNVFGWTSDRDASFAVLDAFVAGGGTMIDTADMYSNWVPGNRGGESEAILGEWLAARGHRDAVLIATKVGKMDGPGGSGLAPSRIAGAAEESLRRLGTDRIDLYYAHQDDARVPQADMLAAFDRLVRDGKVRAIGASNFTADRLASALATSERDGLARFTVVQPEYNLLDRADFAGPLQALCVREGIAALPYYGLASGYLTGKYRSDADVRDSARGGRVSAYLRGRGPAVLAAMDAVAAENGASLAAIALAWLHAQPGVAAPIASASRPEQVGSLLEGAALTLSAEQLTRLDHAYAGQETP